MGLICHNAGNVLEFHSVSLYVVVDHFFLQTPIIKYHNETFLVFVTFHRLSKCMFTLRNSSDFLKKRILNPHSLA